VIATLFNNHKQLEAFIAPGVPCLRGTEDTQLKNVEDAQRIKALEAEQDRLIKSLDEMRTLTTSLRNLVGQGGKKTVQVAGTTVGTSSTGNVEIVRQRLAKPVVTVPMPVTIVTAAAISSKPATQNQAESKELPPLGQGDGSMADLITTSRVVAKHLETVPWEWNYPGQSSLSVVTNSAMKFYGLRQRNGKTPKLCEEWAGTYKVKPGQTWGTLPKG
jgi:hypothetical protein